MRRAGGVWIRITRRFKRIRYNLEILECLEEPITLYGIRRNTNFPYSSIHCIVQEYLTEGIVEIVREEPTRAKLYTKKYYHLTSTGKILLKLAKALEKTKMGD